MVVNIDLAPTIVEMGGGELDSVDGISFLSSLVRDNKVETFEESNEIDLQQNGKLSFDLRYVSLLCFQKNLMNM